MSYSKIDQSSWKRKKQFDFFSQFSEPFFGICFDMDITFLYEQCKKSQESVFIAYLYSILRTANEIEAFRMRIQGEDVLIYEKIGVSPTIARENATFGFAYLDFEEDFSNFSEKAKDEIHRVKNSDDFLPSEEKMDTLHFSTLPWIKFTSVSHARHFDIPDSIPKISCGKIVEKNKRQIMPISVHVHHALMDGHHIGLFGERLSHFFSPN